MQVEEKVEVDVEDIEIDPEEDRVKRLEKRVRKEEVLREMIVTSNGRDKIFVCVVSC